MKRYTLFIITIIGLSALPSCFLTQDTKKTPHRSSSAKPKKSAVPYDELHEIAYSSSLAEEKTDLLFTRYISLMEDGLRYDNTAKGADYILKFKESSGVSLNKIVAESNAWIDKLNKQQGKEYGLRVVKKSYVKSLLEITPNFNKKYKDYAAISEMTGKVMGIFTKIRNKSK